MHLALVSEFDARDVRSWSGIPHFVAGALRRRVDRLSVVSPLPRPATLGQRVRQVRSRLRGEQFLRQHTVEAARAMGGAATDALRDLRPDAVLAIGSTPVGFIETAAPVAFWIDATFESNLYLYGGYASLEARNIDEGHAIEQAALDRADLAVYAAEYAARSARGYYGSERVAVVPFGANLPAPPDAAAVEAAVVGRATDRANLLFIGADWIRKGGDVALRAVGVLNGRGLPARLVVAGVPPPVESPHLRALGFLDKGTPAGRAAFDRALREAQFFVMPSRAEAFGCVFCEASAYGVPSVAANLGGMPTAVRDGVNGLVVPARPTPHEVADAVERSLAEPEAYRALCRSSRARYEAELNWDVAVDRVVTHIEGLL